MNFDDSFKEFNSTAAGFSALLPSNCEQYDFSNLVSRATHFLPYLPTDEMKLVEAEFRLW